MNASVLSYVQAPSLLCAADIALIIPSYQRPYVWPSEDVTDLLDQIIAACDAEAPHYYIGTILTSAVTQLSPRGARTTYEVIDGQQRMTTLMLLALAFTAVVPSNPLAQFIILDNKPRLVFAIREEVQRLFGDWAGLESTEGPRRSSPVDEAYLKHLAAARKALADHLDMLLDSEGEEYVMGVAEYIFSKVRWVNNIMPTGMDLNRLFSTMNNSGVQLEQSDILKARLLGVIAKHKLRYDAIWQACENMEDFFERNLRRVFPSADWKHLKNDDLTQYSATTFPLRNTAAQSEQGVSIAQLAKQIVPENDEPGEKSERVRYCRPIISFSLLLMHTYRIYQQQNGGEDVEVRLHDTRLNEYFEDFISQAGEKEAKAFIESLWQVRYQFDRWVVKWLPETDSEAWHLRLTNVQFRKTKLGYRLARTSLESDDLSQLQSVRNFTGERSAQYWLTPFLGDLVAGKAKTPARVLVLLERIDNELSLAEESQKEASFALLSGERPVMRDIGGVLEDLKVPQGTRFEHYWFQKLEYILWRERGQFNFYDSKKLGTYRVTSKNSVEHVHPRKEEFGRLMDIKHLDSFGNLVLLSPGENSSYSNQSVGKKREDFKGKGRYDSLKLAHMFNAKADRDWDESAIERHQEKMLALISRHYGQAEN
ncbi:MULTISPECIES: DUF262 domain-containing protein [Pseudomonas]|uniref:DUF262 domain-containing protein n=1 Tax=Pseudomonas TaxID=286 RepID=UPI000C07C145|nr:MULTISPECIES: DUF262 domain-containing protein [Pseudomonas]PHN42229.1 hypothetical protein AO259_12795 [Pseudomonas sp. ICMP 564]